jgi:coenzyme PQQ synthesis protein D (PqqD)
MLFRKQSHFEPLTRRQQLSSRPLRLIAGEMSAVDGGGGRLTVKLEAGRRVGWFFRVPEGAEKHFEFDQLGKFVWDHCDGQMSVQQIARRLATTYNLSEREAQIATEKFLTTLAKKGLVAGAVQRQRKDRV